MHTHTHILNFLFSTIGKSQYVRARGGKIIVSITNFTKEFITSISLYLLFLLLSSQIITLSLIDTHKKCKVFFINLHEDSNTTINPLDPNNQLLFITFII